MSEHEQDQSDGGAEGHEQPESRKEPEKVKPTHSVSFARIIGTDRNGRDILGPARQIGTIWPRTGKGDDGILRFDHRPKEMDQERGGVLFTRKLDTLRAPRTNDKESDKERSR
jgi:hypothetical protein